MKIRQGDVVQVISGSYTGKEGRVLRVINAKNRLIIEGINMLKKHKKPTKETKGGIVTKEGYIHLSNLKQLDEGKTKTKDKKWHQG